MSVEEHDWELIEGHLDELLSTEQGAELSTRLTRNAALAGAVEEARVLMSARNEFWTTLEPSAEEANALADRVLVAVRKPPKKTSTWNWWRGIASIAACVAISFAAGWALHAHHVSSLIAVVRPGNPANTPAFEVSLTDMRGHVTAVQPFDSIEKAREFAHDLKTWQEREIQVRKGTAVIVADRF